MKLTLCHDASFMPWHQLYVMVQTMSWHWLHALTRTSCHDANSMPWDDFVVLIRRGKENGPVYYYLTPPPLSCVISGFHVEFMSFVNCDVSSFVKFRRSFSGMSGCLLARVKMRFCIVVLVLSLFFFVHSVSLYIFISVSLSVCL